MPMLSTPLSRTSGGANGPGPPNRTQALYVWGVANRPCRRRGESPASTSNSARTTP